MLLDGGFFILQKEFNDMSKLSFSSACGAFQEEGAEKLKSFCFLFVHKEHRGANNP